MDFLDDLDLDAEELDAEIDELKQKVLWIIFRSMFSSKMFLFIIVEKSLRIFNRNHVFYNTLPDKEVSS